MQKIVMRALVLFSLTHEAFQTKIPKKNSPKILILGAGMAGISAAKRLDELGYTNFHIIEGSNRVGGRIKEVIMGNYTSELGAQWIHGLGSNPIYKLAKDFDLLTLKQDYDHIVVYNATGHDVTNLVYRIQRKFEKAQSFLDKIISMIWQYEKPDTNVKAGLMMAGWHPRTPMENLVEYFNVGTDDAVPPAYISLKFFENGTYVAHGNDEDIIVKDKRGYSYLVRSIKDKFLKENDDRLILNKVVTGVSYNNDSVIVRTHDNHTFMGDYVIVTFSLGVLQHNLVKFRPALPFWKRESINQFKMAIYYHVHLQFPEVFWDNSVLIFYAGTRKGYFSLWQNIDKVHPGSKALYVTLVDEEAKRLDYLSEDAIKAEAMAVLRNMYPNKSIPNPINFLMEKWFANPLFKGSYTSWPSGYTNDTYKGLCAPVGRLYFAGEAYDYHHFGYVHGALYSGRRTSEQIAACNNNIKECETYVPLYLSRGCRYRTADNFDKNAKVDDGNCVFTSALSTAAATCQQKFYLSFLVIVYVFGLPLYFWK